MEPLNKKRKNHEVAGKPPAEHSEDAAGDQHSTPESGANSSVSGELAALQTLRLQHLHLQIGALWALTNVAAGKQAYTL